MDNPLAYQSNSRPNPYASPLQPGHVPSLLGPLELVTPPGSLAAAWLDVAKTHCRVDTDDDDAYIAELLGMAVLAVEESIPGHRQLLTATWRFPVRTWWSRPLRLPRPPLQSVDSITFLDSWGNTQTLDPSIYTVHAPTRAAGWIDRAAFQVWPAHRTDTPWPITVQITCGYGTQTDIPLTLKRAALLWVADAFENRGDSPGPATLDAFERMCSLESFGSYS